MEFDRPGVFGSGGAYAQVFALFTSASAGGVLVGPAWTSFAYGEVSWTLLVVSLGLLNISVAIPVVCSSKARSCVMTLDLTIFGAPAPVCKLENATSSSTTVTSARSLASVHCHRPVVNLSTHDADLPRPLHLSMNSLSTLLDVTLDSFGSMFASSDHLSPAISA